MGKGDVSTSTKSPENHLLSVNSVGVAILRNSLTEVAGQGLGILPAAVSGFEQGLRLDDLVGSIRTPALAIFRHGSYKPAGR